MAAIADDLRAFIAERKRGIDTALPITEDWTEHVRRVSQRKDIVEVTEEQYYYWLEVLPPHFQCGSHFCFAEGAEAFRLFWKERDGRFFCRHLTWEDTVTFCLLAKIPVPW